MDKATDADRLTYRDAETEMDIHGSRQTERDRQTYTDRDNAERQTDKYSWADGLRL